MAAIKSLDREILRLSIPSILANITVPLVGMVDIAVAGHLPNSAAAACIGGVTIGSMLFDLLYWNFGFLRAGTGGITAQAYGRKDTATQANTLIRSLGIALVSALILIALRFPVLQLAKLMTGTGGEGFALAETYFKIRIFAAPATLSLMAFKGWFIGMQDSFSAMLTDLTVNVLNILLSIALAFGVGPFPELGFSGIAYGTLIAQWSGLVLAVCILIFKYSRKVFVSYSLKQALKAFEWSQLGPFFSLNSNLFVRSVCMIFINIGFTAIASRYGDLLLSASSIIMKLMLLFSYFTDGFAYAGEALTGRFYGAGDSSMVKKTIRRTFVWSLSIGAVAVVINLVFARPLFFIMTSEPTIVDTAMNYIIWLALVPIAGCPAFTWDGIYVGLTDVKGLRNSVLLAALAFAGIWFIGEPLLQPSPKAAIHLLLCAYFAHLVVRSVYMTLLRGVKKVSSSR